MKNPALHLNPKETAQQESMNLMDSLVGYILLVGVLLSVVLIVSGTLWNWILNHSLTLQYSLAQENYFTFLRLNLAELIRGAIQPQLLISLGIATLMFTPYLRVAASAVYFAFIAKNLKYTIFTLLVFSVLSYSLFLR